MSCIASLFNNCSIATFQYVQEKRIFQIPWMHAARHGWDLEKDAPLFMKWAIHTGNAQFCIARSTASSFHRYSFSPTSNWCSVNLSEDKKNDFYGSF